MSTLTRQHFECIAGHLLRRQPTNASTKLGYHLAITAVANALVEINPRFDRLRFMAAATGGEFEAAELREAMRQQVFPCVEPSAHK